MKTKQKRSIGVPMAGASRNWKFVESNLLRVYDVDLLGFFTIFHKKFRASYGRPQCVLPPSAETCSSSSSSPNTVSAVTTLQAAVQLEVACFIFCILRDKHLSIDRPVSPFFRLASPAAAGFVCYIAAILLVATS